MWKWLILLFSPMILAFSVFGFWFLYFTIKGYKIKKGTGKVIKESKFKRLFIDFPKRFWLDMFNRDPDTFQDFGLHLIAGEQGSGKTILMVWLIQYYQLKYPKLIVKTNFAYTNQQGEIQHYMDVVYSNNGVLGEIDGFDELQNWFSTQDSKNFPPEMLQEITQQRKQRKMILGTSQKFNRVAKQIREQTNVLYEPMTLMGCLTIVRVYKPDINDEGTVKKKKLRKLFFFVHTDELRNSFDTYKKIERLAKTGFIPTPFAPEIQAVFANIPPKNL
jgi:hypothetical protein